MASPRVVEAESVTTFYLPPKTSYRYNLQLDDNKLRILMEDITSKKQWCKGNMAKGDYITPANSITDASVPDYIKFFQDVLDCELDKFVDVQRGSSLINFCPVASCSFNESGKIHF